jgi:hypothetical protein
MQDGHTTTFVPHLEQLSLSLRAGFPMQQSNEQEKRQKEQNELEFLRSIVARLNKKADEFRKYPPGKMYKAQSIVTLLFEIMGYGDLGTPT